MSKRSLVPGMALILICQCAGEVLSRLTSLGLPGPVIGMLFMLLLLNWTPARANVSVVADGLLNHLSLLFVPVGVGVMTHLSLLSEFGWQILLTLLLSTWIGLAATALVLRTLQRRSRS